MSGYVSVLGPCVRCRRPFLFSPTRVPSIRVRGSREPVCPDCLAVLNRVRQEAGLEPWTVRPDAYDPGDPEAEVPADD